MLQRGFTTVRDAGGADGGLAEAVEEGLVRGPRIFPSGQALSQTGGHGDLRPRTRSVSVVACACCEGGAGLARIADGVGGMPPRGARRAAQRGDPDQDHGLGRRRLALRPGVEPAIQRRGGARDRRGSARLAHLCDGARLFARGDPPLDRFRRALDRARQSDRPRHRRACRRRRRLCCADPGDLRCDAPLWQRTRISRG